MSASFASKSLASFEAWSKMYAGLPGLLGSGLPRGSLNTRAFFQICRQSHAKSSRNW